MNWLSPKSIAKKLDMSPKTVLRMLERRELPYVEFSSGRKRVSEEALERFLKKAERKGQSDNGTQASTYANDYTEGRAANRDCLRSRAVHLERSRQ